MLSPPLVWHRRDDEECLWRSGKLPLHHTKMVMKNRPHAQGTSYSY